MSDRRLYTDRLLSYWDQNLFGWKHSGYTHGASEVSRLCGDEVEFRLIVNNGILDVVDVWARLLRLRVLRRHARRVGPRQDRGLGCEPPDHGGLARVRQRAVGREPQTKLPDAPLDVPAKGRRHALRSSTATGLT